MSEELTNILPDDKLSRILERLDSIDGRLERLEARAYDTKPIWENALQAIAEIAVEMRAGFEKSEAGQRRLERKIDILNQNILDVRTDQRELEERLDKLDSQPAR